MSCCNDKKCDLRLLDGTLNEYKRIPGSLITVLQKTQEIYGYLPMDAIYHIASEMDETPAKVLGVATFYSQFRFQEIGKYLIMLCKGTACYVNGADSIKEAISEQLGIQDGETTPDRLFTLNIVACLGCCSLAPVMMINGVTYGSLTPDKTREILQKLQEEATK